MAAKALTSQIVRFATAGGVGVALYYVILYTLTDILGVWYILSTVLASVVNYGSNFTLQKFWTFQNKDVTRIYE